MKAPRTPLLTRQDRTSGRAAPAVIGCVVLCLLWSAHALPVGPDDATALPAPVAQAARSLDVPESAISIWLQGIGDPAPRVAVNADVFRNPASALKLVTTFAALERLGPAYTWSTAWYLGNPPGGDPPGGDLLGPEGATGDLWVRGGGDPYLVLEEHWKMLAALRERGLVRIGGDLVIDTTQFDLPPEDRGAFDGQPDRVYNVLPHGYLVNFNAARFRVRAQADGAVSVSADPPLPNLVIDNRLRTAPGACQGFQFGVAIAIRDAAARDRAVLDGRFPSICREYELSRSVLQPESYAWGLFDLHWRQLGGTLAGGWRAGRLPDDAGAPFHVHRSRPLGELIRLVNKFSNNVMTRHFELALATELYGAPATPAKGQRAILDVLAERGIDTRGMVIANSAGLARETRITARQLASVLEAAWNSPFMPEFVSSLALAGYDGTLRTRFRGESAAGRMHLKTGRLDEVSAVAGYVTAASGHRMMVVLMVNARDAHRGPGEELQDALLQWVYRHH